MTPEAFAKLEARVARLERAIVGMLAERRAPSVPSSDTATNGSRGGRVATVEELRDQFGDPKIKWDPKKWTGRSYVGAYYSQTEPVYLDTLASFLDWCAAKEAKTPGKEQYADRSRDNAAKARGWAALMRAPGWVPRTPAAEPEAAQDDSQDEEIAF